MLGDCVITGEECPSSKMPEQSSNVLKSPASTTLTSPPPSKKLKQARLPFKILDQKAIIEVKPINTSASGKKRKPTDTVTPQKAPKVAKGDDANRSKANSARQEDSENEVSSSSEAELQSKGSDQKTGKPRGLERFVQSTQQLEVSTSCEDVIDLCDSNDKTEDATPSAKLVVSPETISTENPQRSKKQKTSANESKCLDETKERMLTKPLGQLDTESSGKENIDGDETCLKKPEEAIPANNLCPDYDSEDGSDGEKADGSDNSASKDLSVVTSVVSQVADVSDDSGAEDLDRKNLSAAGSSLTSQPSTPSTPSNRTVKGRPPLSASKSKQREEERQKKQDEREKIKEEKQRQKDLEKQKKEEQRKEKERLRDEQRLEKEKQKKEEKDRKEQERLQREKERQEKLAEKEKEKEEKLRQKEEEKKKKQDAIDAKLEEKKRKEEEREEEKKKREEEKLKMDMMKNKKIQQSQSLFKNFFKKVEPMEPVKTTVKVGPFSAFHVLPNMKMAPRVRVAMATARLEQLDQHMEAQSATELYMALLRSGEVVAGISGKTWPYDEDLIILDAAPGEDVRPRMRAKLLKFHENYRPAYFGTWRKQSKVISARNPFKKDEVYLDYEVDSDDEWEEEEPGESLSNSEGEGDADGEENKEDEDDNDGFFVPHGYLSDGEGCEDDEEDGNPEKMKMRQLIKARTFEADLKKRTEVLRMSLVGCRWCQSGEDPDPQLGQYSASFLVDESPIMIGNEYTGSTNGSKTKKKTVKDTKESRGLKPQHVPDEAMSHLIRLIHGNIASMKKLIREFRVFWSRTQKDMTTGCAGKPVAETGDGIQTSADTSEQLEAAPDATALKKASAAETDASSSTPSPMDVDEPEGASSISKRQLDLKIRAIAAYQKRKCHPIKCWYVSEDILQKHGLVDLPVPTEWKWITPGPRQRPPKVTSESTPTAKKPTKESLSSPVPTNHSIKQFAVPGLIHANTLEVRELATLKSKTPTTKTGTPSHHMDKKGLKKTSAKPITLFCSKKGSIDCLLKLKAPATGVVSNPIKVGIVDDDDDCMIVDEQFVPPPPSKSQPTLLSMFSVKNAA